MKKILLGISGGIAAYKTPELVRLLTKEGYEVQCVLTQSAHQFVSPLVLETLSGRPVKSALWGDGVSGTEHIELARWPDLILLAPATAHLISRLSLGLADDLLSTLILATHAPTLIAPAMNTAMWENPITQEHCDRLRKLGFKLVPPEAGDLACGETGAGRLPDPALLIEQCNRQLRIHPSLRDTTWLITAGPTKTFIDPVRYITNPSSGMMGKALAEEGLARGAKIHYVLGIDKGVVRPRPTSPEEASRLSINEVHTAEQMLEISLQILPQVDGVIASAAVMDYEVSSPSPLKLKRSDSKTQLELSPAIDVLKALKSASQNLKTIFVGFAAETDQVLENGIRKLESKKLDYLFANPISKGVGQGPLVSGFGSSTNCGYWITPTSHTEWPLQAKREIASKIWDQLSAASRRAH